MHPKIAKFSSFIIQDQFRQSWTKVLGHSSKSTRKLRILFSMQTSPPPPPLTMLISTTLIDVFVFNIVWGDEGGGRGHLGHCKNRKTKVFLDIHLAKYKVCPFCACFSKVSQGLLARIV